MEPHEFEIEIRPGGKVRVHIKGVKGHACMDYAKLLEQIVGSVAEVEHTSEYYEPPANVEIHLEDKAQD